MAVALGTCTNLDQLCRLACACFYAFGCCATFFEIGVDNREKFGYKSQTLNKALAGTSLGRLNSLISYPNCRFNS